VTGDVFAGQLDLYGDVVVLPAGASLSDLAQTANREHELAREHGLAMVEHAIRAGEALLEAKAQVKHGEWLPWLDANFDASERTARGYMAIASNRQRVADLEEPSLRKALEAVSHRLALDERYDRETLLAEERAAVEAEARERIARLGPLACVVEHADVRTWRPDGVDAIVTDPPYITDDAVALYSALADFALDVLPERGALFVMAWQPILPAVLEAMRRDRLVYRWQATWAFETPHRTPDQARRVFSGGKPVLVFHKDGWNGETTYLYDFVRSPSRDKAVHPWQQGIEGFRQLVRAASRAGDVVCDPFLGGGTTAVAALAEDRLFVGCDVDAAAVETTRRRLAAEIAQNGRPKSAQDATRAVSTTSESPGPRECWRARL
jgi:hypothetical protein